MVYQPVVDVRSGITVGTEALARFESDPYRTPDRWFAEADNCGLGVELEVAAVRAALGMLEEIDPDVYVAVNVSPSTLLSVELREILAQVPGRRVVLELTEHARVADYGVMQHAVAFYRSRGFRLAIDDAGSGFASFQHILQLRPDIIKLDRALTIGVDSNPVKFALASALVTFALSLGASICAEGIESATELVALQQLGVRFGQGYFLARPGPLPLQEAPRGIWFSPRSNARSNAREPAAGSRQPSPALRSASRLSALRSTELMDSAPEEELDRFTRLAARLLGAPVALVSLVDETRQFFKSAVGIDIRETPLSHSFCAHVVTGRSELVVNDTAVHPLVADNPVVGELGVAAYAGVPIMTANDEALGSFCVVDGKPRVWTESELASLRDLAAAATAQIDLRRKAREFRRSAALFETVLDHVDVGVLVLDLDLDIEHVSRSLALELQRTEEELVGSPLMSIKVAGDLLQSFAMRDELLSGRSASVQASLRFLRRDATEVWLPIDARVVRDEHGAPRSFLMTVQRAPRLPLR